MPLAEGPVEEPPFVEGFVGGLLAEAATVTLSWKDWAGGDWGSNGR